MKALSGFYYVDIGGGETVVCRARGKLRHQKVSPLVGDWVEITQTEPGTGMVDAIDTRRNEFSRPAVANIDQLIIIASGAIPVTDSFLIDRMTAIAQYKGCSCVICFNKSDLDRAEDLYQVYVRAGFQTLRVSAESGEGVEALRKVITGKLSAFTGNSGVGKSSILNALSPDLGLQVGQVSEKLGRGRHTTRHVELFPVAGGYVADTPGFSSFDVEQLEWIKKEDLAASFPEFRPYLGQCRFAGCSHTKEKGCAVLEALKAGKIAPSRNESYVRLYRQVRERKSWEK